MRALARSDAGAARLDGLGAEVVRGDVTRPRLARAGRRRRDAGSSTWRASSATGRARRRPAADGERRRRPQRACRLPRGGSRASRLRLERRGRRPGRRAGPPARRGRLDARRRRRPASTSATRAPRRPASSWPSRRRPTASTWSSRTQASRSAPATSTGCPRGRSRSTCAGGCGSPIDGGLSYVDARDIAAGHPAGRGARPLGRALHPDERRGQPQPPRLLRPRRPRDRDGRAASCTCPRGCCGPLLRVGSALRLPLPLDDQELASSSHWWFFTAAKARAELGFTVRPIEDTIRDTAEWLRADGYHKH